MRAIHRPQYHAFGLEIHGRKHIFVIVLPVARFLVKLYFGQVRRVHMLVTGLTLLLKNVVFQDPTYGCTLWEPQRQTSPDQFVDSEEFKLLADSAVVSFPCLFKPR